MKPKPFKGNQGNLNLRGGFNPGAPLLKPGLRTPATSGQRPPTKVDPILGAQNQGSARENAQTQSDARGSRRKGKRRAETGAQPPRGGNTFIAMANFGDDSSSSSENFNSDAPDNSRNGLFPERRSSPLTFDYGASFPLNSMQLEDNYTRLQTTSDGSTRNQIVKLTWNTSSYSENFLDHENALIPQTTWSRQLTIIYERYSRDIVANIRSKIVDSWTLANFKSYLKDCCDLLEYFYCVDSILSYEGSLDNPDRNPVLMQMKQEMSNFGILKMHDDARRILKNCWFPDKFSALIAWTFQNYKTGPGYQCSNYRQFCHYSLFKFSGVAFDASAVIAEYTIRIDRVTGTTPQGVSTLHNRNIISLLAQTYPQGIIKTLPLSCSESVYDEKHYESYVNQGIMWSYNWDNPTTDPFGNMNTSFIGYPHSSESHPLEYSLYCSRRNAEDCTAFPFVLSSSWNTQLRKFTDGALIPVCFGKEQDGTDIASGNFYHVTNKHYAWTPILGTDTYSTYGRNWHDYSYLTACQDVHTMNQDISGVTPTGNYNTGSGCNSMAKGDFQNFYFNVNEARRIVMRDFLNSLFYLK